MKPTKRQSDPLGRSRTRHRYSRYLLSLAVAITGSVWPIQARSIEAIFDRRGPAPLRQASTRRRPQALTARADEERVVGSRGLQFATAPVVAERQGTAF